MRLAILSLGGLAVASCAQVPAPPDPEPIEVVELPLPPVSSSNATGACTDELNPRKTGCIAVAKGEFQAGDFTPDGNQIIVNVEFVGAPAAPDPASIYMGEQAILVKTDGTKFPNGDPWKCLSCGVPAKNARALDPQRDYPHVFRSGDRVLWGHNILDCNGNLVQSDECTPEETRIFPIHWPTAVNGSGPGGAPRELRLHPDDVHMGFSSFTSDGGQFAYVGRLKFNKNPTTGIPLAPRYDLVDVNLLVANDGEEWASTDDGEMHFDFGAIKVGELRGFSGTGDEILYIGPPNEASNIDVFAVHVITGSVRRLTTHPEYTDPVAFSHDNGWFLVMDTRGSGRQMFLSGMRGIPPVTDIVAASVVSSTRNNRARRFFQPYLLDGYGDRDPYYGQQINAAGNGSNGAVNDPNWNGLADPAFSYDGTKVTYYQSLVVSPSCGGANPLPCPNSTAQGGREYRVMLADLTNREPSKPPPAFEMPDSIPWATPFPPGSAAPPASKLETGKYKLQGKVSGVANVGLEAGTGPFGIKVVSAEYSDYSDDGDHILNGYENITLTIDPENPWLNTVDWYSDITQTGAVNGSKKTSPDGFHLRIDVLTNIFDANGTLTTVLDGVEWKQPANGT